MAKRDKHVTPHPKGGWQVKSEGADRAGSRHPTQRKAIDRARDSARRERTEVVIHDRKGRIRDSDSYGNDPNPPKDKKH